MIKEFYDGLDEASKKQFVKQVLEITDWSLPTFYYKLSHNNYSKLEQEALTKLIESWQQEKK
jgi:hypothetical protein